jgi:transcriptional regulator with XRE-family HTH domain
MTPPANDQAPADQIAPRQNATRMSAGTYLRKRRQAAGLTPDQVAAACMVPPFHSRFAERLRQIEADKDSAAAPTLILLRGVFHFMPDIYQALLADLPTTQICRNCGCTWCDACMSANGPCSWAEPDLCTACMSAVGGIESPPEPTFTVRAGDPYAVTVVSILGLLHLGEFVAAERQLRDTIRRQITMMRRVDVEAEIAADAIMRDALAMSEWRVNVLGPLPEGGVVHV